MIIALKFIFLCPNLVVSELLFFFSITEHSNDNHAFAGDRDILYTNPTILNENIGDDNIEGVYSFMERASIDVDRSLGEDNEEVYETVRFLF